MYVMSECIAITLDWMTALYKNVLALFLSLKKLRKQHCNNIILKSGAGWDIIYVQEDWKIND